jgi:predicted dehydrogenase
MSKRSLVIGMGIGQLYKTVLEKLGHEVITVDHDITKGAMLPTVESAMLSHAPFDTVHICTPNFTHEVIARTVARVSKIVFIEKPGVIDSKCWQCLVEDFPNTRFMMVKNNMWRSNIKDLLDQATHAKQVHIRWIRKNCIPSPGSWFTNKSLAFGGVSRDLMPHLLSLFVAMNPKWKQSSLNGQTTMARWELKDIESTEYGTVYPNGTYNVDDICIINFGNKWRLAADWRSMDQEDSSIMFIMEDNTVSRFQLGWCPEEAYHNMIVDAITNVNNQDFWSTQYNIDKWIHERIENL